MTIYLYTLLDEIHILQVFYIKFQTEELRLIDIIYFLISNGNSCSLIKLFKKCLDYFISIVYLLK